MLTHSSHTNRAFNIETAIIKDIAKQVSVTIIAHTTTTATTQATGKALTLSLRRHRLD
jgi:hypothetical protein